MGQVDQTSVPTKIVVIGNGMAAGRAMEELFAKQRPPLQVTVFGAEPRVNYNRIMLSPVLSGEKTFEQIIIHDEAWYAKHCVRLRSGQPIVAIDRKAKTVVTSGGDQVPYDKLVIATGSQPFVIPVPGANLEGVVTFRDLDDVEKMHAAAATGGNAVVIGGGLLGLEAAAGLALKGMKVSVVHLMPTLMERQLDPSAGYLLEKAISERGIDVYTKANTEAILGSDRVTGVKLKDGAILPADLVVMAVGIRPNFGLGKAAGLDCNRGIVVDDWLRTSDPDIFALGECVEHRGQCYGLVAPLYEMAKVLASELAGEKPSGFVPAVTSAKLKVTGIDLFSAGDFSDDDENNEIVLRDPARGIYKRVVIHDNKIIGAVLYGDTEDGGWYFDLLKKGEDVGAIRDTLIFGQAYQGGSPLDPTAAVAALPDDAEICGCNGVSKGSIVAAITSGGLATLEDLRAKTKASASCGQCTGKVELLLAATLGESYESSGRKPMCKCTDLTHEEVRRLIKTKPLKSQPAVMQELGWKTSGGCPSCQPALNYYLLCDWPLEYKDDYQARFINERVHANIQKDGTFSVVPRMWGGVTSAAELRAIADVVDQFKIPMVKVTGGQRIDLLGVKKQDLPAVWAQLIANGLMSGFAYGKSLRTIKTCVGSEFCRFGTQDSTGLGIKLEKLMCGAWTPAKLKLAVSGCPRNCAESTVKDIGVICVDSGYDLHIAGAAGLHVKATDLLGHVDSEEEALEYIAAVAQKYREEANYLDRLYKWVEKTGLEHVRRAIMEDHDNRKALYERFLLSQRVARKDPWAERVAGRDLHEFMPLAVISRIAAE
ncbi:nitrite reductase large subunit NirB [Rhodoblastus acidophilus]|uniref:Nitrite reductase large subunit NirB n=1 Tax=Candidatus Rhodoblastus alkanivorans TaxID=2954117 RepID=A0ABS9Z965_9HYPH|nr:nitrite reductase large subunit NirB [Candidatus Rhodoblastus alkanivorans]MCI4678969.1 nitrite reductase large subunit NirB [Candidatus Rhodoblastus alkanivorans]MCI4683747.1 nitrite reductase large subunit NirB [Candidatus Rhodoblastus alkanivorans]MDI4641065.1 nitrite reductase large subunit NirB [Rhodoblastus acidophilus]